VYNLNLDDNNDEVVSIKELSIPSNSGEFSWRHGTGSIKFYWPKSGICCLSAIAACLCIYSITCFFFLKTNWTPFIMTISFANLLYCILTMGFLIIYYPLFTIVGVTYFLVEITIIVGFAYIEFNVATATKKKRINNDLNN